MAKSFLNRVDLNNQAIEDESSNPIPDLETGRLTDAEEDSLSVFFQNVASITMEMEDLYNLLPDLHLINQDNKSTHSPKLLRRIANQIDSDMVAVLRKAHVVKIRLIFLEGSNAANRQISPVFGEGSPMDRTRISVICGIRNKLRGTLNEFQALTAQIVADHHEGLRGSYVALTGKLSNDEELGEMICENGRMSIFSSTKNKMLVLEANERRRAVTNIQRSFNRLQIIFLDKEIVVGMQGEQLIDIKENVASVNSFMSKTLLVVTMGKLAIMQCARTRVFAMGINIFVGYAASLIYITLVLLFCKSL